MRKLAILLVSVLLLLSYVPLLAQDVSHQPPQRLQLVVEDVKPGKSMAHQKSEELWLAAFKKANVPAYGIAMTSMTGHSQAWFINEMGKSWAELESWNKQIDGNAAVRTELAKAGETDGELISGSRTYYLDYVPELSYRPEFNLGDARFFMVDLVRVKLGHGKEFADIRKAVNAAHEKANMDEHMIVYYVANGAPSGTYLIFEPIKSIASLDEIDKWHEKDSAYQKALGEDFPKMNREFAMNGLQSVENNMFAISPEMSWVSEQTAKADPKFWNPKPAVAKSKPMKKEAAPAAQKEGN